MTEALKIPKEVVDADWKDDIPELDYEPYGSNKEEMEYVSTKDVSKESIEKIKSIKFRERAQKVGLLTKDKIAV